MQISMQEFKSHLSRYVVEAQSGQLIELTSHRKVVARLIGVPAAENVGVSRLLATGMALQCNSTPAHANDCNALGTHYQFVFAGGSDGKSRPGQLCCGQSRIARRD